MSIDLSFTQDPDWIAERANSWKPHGKNLATDLDKNVVEGIRHYYMTGELLGKEPDHDGARLSWFPLQTPEGWDYVFEHLIRSPDAFEEAFYYSLQDQSDRRSYDEQLEFWDYFHPKEYEAIVKSRVPIGRDKHIVTIEVIPEKVVSFIWPSITTFIRSGGQSLKILRRLEYFISCLKNINYDENKKYKKRDPLYACQEIAAIFFSYIHSEKKWRDLDNYAQERRDLVVFFRSCFEEGISDFPTFVQDLWFEADR